MKRVALIIVPIFLLLSIAVTVYLVVTQRLELRKKAEEVYNVGYCSPGRTYPDRCSGGPYVEIEQRGISYSGNLQTFTLRAKRIGVRTDVTPLPTVTPHEVQCASVGDCNKAEVCWMASACHQQQCIYVKRPDETVCSGGRCSDGVCVPNPAATATSVPPTNTPVPPINTPTPVGSDTSAEGQTLGATTINDRINVHLVSYACSAGAKGGCANCGSTNRQEWNLEIPGGANTSGDFTISLSRFDSACGCTQMDLYILGVTVNGQAKSCPERGNNTSGYLCASGQSANDCPGLPTSTPRPPVSRTPTPSVSPTPTPPTTASPTPTPTPSGPTTTPTTNQYPLCIGLSASPTSGTAPLTVHFIGTGEDPDGPVEKFEFDYGDGKTQAIEKDVGNRGTVEIDHTYTLSGTFISTLRIQDNNGIWSSPSDECSQTITTSGGPTVTPRSTSTPPPTKTPTPIKVVSASATPVEPNVPVSGRIVPTMLVGISGLLVIGLGLLFAL